MFWKKNNNANQKKMQQAAEQRSDIDFKEQLWPWDQLTEHFSTNLERGLTLQQVLSNREKYGLNALTPPKKRNELLAFLE